MRTAAKVDVNQSEIVAALRGIGASVQLLHAVGQGCPDILVGWQGDNYLLEVKRPDVSPSHRALTAAERLWHLDWRGQVKVVYTVDDALEAVGAI
jgi:hypothetical protein